MRRLAAGQRDFPKVEARSALPRRSVFESERLLSSHQGKSPRGVQVVSQQFTPESEQAAP